MGSIVKLVSSNPKFRPVKPNNLSQWIEFGKPDFRLCGVWMALDFDRLDVLLVERSITCTAADHRSSKNRILKRGAQRFYTIVQRV